MDPSLFYGISLIMALDIIYGHIGVNVNLRRGDFTSSLKLKVNGDNKPLLEHHP